MMDRAENITFTKAVEFNLEGHRLQGTLDVTAGSFSWIRNGRVTDGIQKTNLGVLRLDALSVSRRDDTLYAVLVTQATNVAAVEMYRCELDGVVAGRQGICRWVIEGCTNNGIDDGDGNVPYRLLEADGIARTFSNVSVSINGAFSGAIAYAKGAGSIVSAAPNYLAVNANVWPSADEPAGSIPSPRSFTILMVVGAATGTITSTDGEVAISVKSHNGQGATTPGFASNVAFLRGRNCTGSGTLNLQSPSIVSIDVTGFTGDLGLVVVDGTAAMTGTLTLDGGFGGIYITGGMGSIVSAVILNSAVTTGTVTVQNDIFYIKNAETFSGILINSAQAAAAPAITVASFFIVIDVEIVRIFGVLAAVSVGTWTFSGEIFGESTSNYSCALPAAVTGGTWALSGNVTLSLAGQYLVILDAASHAGSGGTLTVSGTFTASGGIHSSFQHCRKATGAGGTATKSGASSLKDMRFAGAFSFVLSGVAGGTADGSGAITCTHCRFDAEMIIVNRTGAATGPTATAFELCVFASTLTAEAGAGAITWVAATLRFMDCHIGGLFTVVGTRFSTVEAFETFFNGNSANKSITATGVRPSSTYRFWKCGFAARYDDLLPESINEYDVLPAQAALVQGQPVIVNAANQYQVCVLTSIVDAVSLDAPAGAGSRTIGVRNGRVFVAAKAGTVNGDNLALDLATPAQCNLAPFTPGQNVGTALENVGTTVAGKCYAAVGVR